MITLSTNSDLQLWKAIKLHRNLRKKLLQDGRCNLPSPLCTNSTKRTLVKDLHFIGPELSHLIKLTVTEWATWGQQGDWEIGWYQDRVTLKYAFHSIFTRWSFQAAEIQKNKIKSQPQRQLTPNLNNVIAAKNPLWITDFIPTSSWHLLEHLGIWWWPWNHNEQEKISSVESRMNTLVCVLTDES